MIEIIETNLRIDTGTIPTYRLVNIKGECF